jgi:hypothetical protein
MVVALKVPVGQFVQVRLALVEPGLLTNVPRAHVVRAVHCEALVVAVKFTPAVQFVQVRSLEAEPAMLT